VAAVAMAPVAAAVWWAQHAYNGGQLSTLGLLALGGIVALGVYILVLRATMTRRASAVS
jgi:hypothetical protein